MRGAGAGQHVQAFGALRTVADDQQAQALVGRMGRGDQAQEGVDQGGVALHFVMRPDAADHERIVLHEAGRADRGWRAQTRVVLHAVDPVGDLRDAARLGADRLDQPVFEIGADGDEVANQWPQYAPQQLVLEAAAIQVAHVAPMLAMHPQFDAGQRGDQLTFEAAQVAGVDQVRMQCAQGAEHAQVVAEVLALAFVQADDVDPALLDMGVVFRVVLQTDDGVAVAFRRHVLDQVDEAIFEASDAKLMDQVHYQTRCCGCR